MDADVKRDLVRKAILLQIKNGFTRYTRIKDKATIHCNDFASSNSIKKQLFKYLLPQGYIKRINPGKYQLTQKGELILTVYSQNSTA
jgi:predicted transcriptional regulator